MGVLLRDDLIWILAFRMADHRLSTIRNADRIYVMDRGEIVEQGNYAELVAMDGSFARLIRQQT